MSTWSDGRIEWELWKLDHEGLTRLARDAWMFETPKAERPGHLDDLRKRLGAYLIALGERLIQNAQPAAASNIESRRSIAP
jgi:hypothetical protein